MSDSAGGGRVDSPSTGQPAAGHAPPMPPHRLGWLLIDALDDVLPEPARTSVYVHLGCRHYRRAITAALEASAATGTVIPEALANEIACWLAAYGEHPDQGRLQRLLARTRARPTG
jgi:hypothetical protein